MLQPTLCLQVQFIAKGYADLGAEQRAGWSAAEVGLQILEWSAPGVG
jgi:hypothetical protein